VAGKSLSSPVTNRVRRYLGSSPGHAVSTIPRTNAMNPADHALGSGQTLRIRDAVPEDAARLLDYLAVVSAESDFLSFGRGEFDLDEAQQAEVLGGFLRSDNQLYILALMDDLLAGALFFDGGSRPRLRHVGEFGMSVLQDHSGMGVGQIMIETMLEWARSTGIVKTIDLRVRVDNTRAIRMYERNGFIHEGTMIDQMRIDGTSYDAHAMGLVIES